eukprot:scaffold103779_cov51-Phaeocystis_antarctica.AAC.1
MMRLPTGRVTVCGTGRQWGKEGGKSARGSPPPDDAAALSSLLDLADYAAVATPHAAAPFTADEKAASALGMGVEVVTAAAPVAAASDHSMTDETLAEGKEAEQAGVEVGVEVVTAIAPASPRRCDTTVELTRTEAEGLLMLLADGPKAKDEAEGLLMLLADGQRTGDEAAQEPASTSHTAAEAAVFSLLDLRQGSVAAPPPQPARPRPHPAPRAAPAPRPPPKSRADRGIGGGGVVKRRGIADLATQFVCRHPACGKAYGCPDAVRKHCRKEHSDWLRDRPNHGPEGYCSWEAGI